MRNARMGLRGRLLVAGGIALLVAASLIGWGASQQANYKWQAEHQTAENARHADYDIRYRCVPLPPLAERNCSIDRRREQREYERNEQDLYAQKTAAFWTFLMGSAAIVGMILSAVGVFLVFFTFGETRRANVLNMRENARATRRAIVAARETAEALEAANKSAVAAAGQVEIARETAYRQLRAYISFEDVKIKTAAAASLAGQMVIRNAGKTPATIEMYLYTWAGPHPLDALPPAAPAPLRYIFHGPFVNADGRDTIDWFYPMPGIGNAAEAAEKIAAMIANPTSPVLYLYGRVEFVDHMKKKRILHFAYRNHGCVAIGKGCDMIPTKFGNYYEYAAEDAPD